MANIVELKDSTSTKCYPLTKAQAVYFDDGSTVVELKNNLLDGGYVNPEIVFYNGGYISSDNGVLVTYDHWKYTDYIDISARTTDNIYAYTTSPDNRSYNAFYDSSNAFISSFAADNKEVAVPTKAKYVRMSCQEANNCGVKIYVNGRIPDIENKIDTNKEDAYDDAYFLKAQLEFEAGGVGTDGHDYYGTEQKNRLRSKYAFANRDYVIRQTATLNSDVKVWYIVYYWDSDDFSQNASSQSGWYSFPNNPSYTISKGSYFRILIYSEQYTDPISDVKESVVYQCFDVVAASEIGTGIVILNKGVETFTQSLPTSYPVNLKSYVGASHTPLTFAHFSDIHNRQILWGRIAEYVDEYSTYLPFALHTGDYVGDNQEGYTDLYAYYMPSVPFLNCVGNHDTYADAQHTLATKQSAYEKLFNHCSNWGVTFMSGDYSMTYYKDFTDSNIRLIVFDNYYDISAQKTWLASILEDARAKGMHVITASHQVTGRPQTKIDCTFESIINYETAGSGSLVNTEFDAVIGTFIQNGGVHVAHLCGHEHSDHLYKTANGVLNCAVECATDWIGWTEGARAQDTKSWDCFNAIGVDTDTGILKIVRIGHNVDHANRAKNVLSYDYINSIVLNNE